MDQEIVIGVLLLWYVGRDSGPRALRYLLIRRPEGKVIQDGKDIRILVEAP